MLVKLPRTASDRAACTHIKLLERVAEFAPHALGFEGKILRPGSMIEISSLPCPAVLLECAGMIGPRKKRECLWLIWTFDFERSEWREIARAASASWEWALALRPVAIYELRGRREPPHPHIPEITQRIVAKIDEELEAIGPRWRPQLLSALEPELAGRIAWHMD